MGFRPLQRCVGAQTLLYRERCGRRCRSHGCLPLPPPLSPIRHRRHIRHERLQCGHWRRQQHLFALHRTLPSLATTRPKGGVHGGDAHRLLPTRRCFLRGQFLRPPLWQLRSRRFHLLLGGQSLEIPTVASLPLQRQSLFERVGTGAQPSGRRRTGLHSPAPPESIPDGGRSRGQRGNGR